MQHGCNAWPRVRSQLLQTQLQQIARIGSLIGQVGHDAKRHKIKQSMRKVILPGQQGFNKFVSHAHTRQVAQRMRFWQAFWVDNGLRSRL